MAGIHNGPARGGTRGGKDQVCVRQAVGDVAYGNTACVCNH